MRLLQKRRRQTIPLLLLHILLPILEADPLSFPPEEANDTRFQEFEDFLGCFIYFIFPCSYILPVFINHVDLFPILCYFSVSMIPYILWVFVVQTGCLV